MSGPDLSGTVIDGRYQVIEPIAEGAMGAVYRGERLKLGKAVAIKIMHDALPDELASRQRFEREAKLMARLEHPHCVSVLDFGLHDNRPFLVMDLVRGTSVQELLDKHGRFEVTRAVDLVRQVLSGLGHAHELGVIHRDIKPANIMLAQKTGLGEQVRILDFGLARPTMSDGTKLTTGIVVGTPNYMSPEQIKGVDVDGRADLYAVTVMLFELITGRKPFVADDPIAVVRKHLNEPAPTLASVTGAGTFDELEPVIARGLAKNPNDRYANAAELSLALEQAIDKHGARQVADLMAHAVPKNMHTGPSGPPQVATMSGWSVPSSGAIPQAPSDMLVPIPDSGIVPVSGPGSGSSMSGPTSGPIHAMSGPASGPTMSGPTSGPIHAMSGPTSGPIHAMSGPASGPTSGPIHAMSGPASGSVPNAIPGSAPHAIPGSVPNAIPGSRQAIPGSVPNAIPGSAPHSAPIPTAIPSSPGSGPFAGSGPSFSVPLPQPPGASGPSHGALHAGSSGVMVTHASGAMPAANDSQAATSLALDTVPQTRRNRIARRKWIPELPLTGRWQLIALGGGVLLLIIIIVAARGGGHTKHAIADAAVAQAKPDAPAGDPVATSLARASDLYASGDLEPALDVALKGRRQHPDNAQLAFLTGKIYFAKLFWSDGLKNLRDAIRLDAGYRTDPELIKIALRGFITTPDTDSRLEEFLRLDLGEVVKPYLEETARENPNGTVRARAAAELRRMH